MNAGQPCVAGSLSVMKIISEGNSVIGYAALIPKSGCKVTAFQLNCKINHVNFGLQAGKTAYFIKGGLSHTIPSNSP